MIFSIVVLPAPFGPTSATRVVAFDGEVDAAVDLLLIVALVDALQVDRDAAAARCLGQTDLQHALRAVRRLQAVDSLELLDAALHQRRLRRLVAEPRDERLDALDLLLLVLVRCARELEARLAFLEVAAVVHRVVGDPAVQDLGDAVDRDVEEVAIVRDQDDGTRVRRQELLEPVPRFEVEVVRRLVEQQHVGPAQQELREVDAHLPAAGEIAAVAVHVGVDEAQAVQHRLRLGFDVVAAVVVPLLADGHVAIHDRLVAVALGVDGGHLVLEIRSTCFEGMELRERRERVVEHGDAALPEDVLRQVADAGAARHRHAAAVGLELAGQDLQQGGFAGTVRAREPDPGADRHAPPHVVEDDLRAVALAYAGQGNHQPS
jgi:hypothetical protein